MLKTNNNMQSQNRLLLAGLLLCSFCAFTSVSTAQDLTELFPDEDASEALDTLKESADEQVDSALDAASDRVESSAVDAVSDISDQSSSLADLISTSNPYALPKDVVMVLDNSGSMKKNDPGFLATKAVSEFISGLDDQTRIAIVIFDQGVNLAVALTDLNFESRDQVLTSLENVNYKGLYTDSPAAIERAIYELKNSGRAEAQKSIVFMTDGIVDTGNPEVDLEKSKWLKEDLAADAADEEIKVFGIAFTEAADFQLIQSIAQKTDGEYYRALQASDLQTVFQQINTILNSPPEPEPVEEYYQEPEPVEVEAPVVQQPVIIEVPAQAPAAMSKEERLRSTIMMVAAAILLITLLAILYLLLKRSKESAAAAEEVVSDAFINDPQNFTGISQYRLGTKPTMFGRVAGKDADHLNYIVIPESTIGRRHALIEYKDYGYWISDQGSINGTFVNDMMITSEVCLKHGDRVRLHKYEFEFSMPEMDDAGMTVMSNTQFAGAPTSIDAPADVAEAVPNLSEMEGMDPEFDITGGVGAEAEFNLDSVAPASDDDDETLVRGDSGMAGDITAPGAESTEDEGSAGAVAAADDGDSEDETLLPISAGMSEDTSNIPSADSDDGDSEDETLMRGNFDGVEDDDMTIRKNADEAIEDFFDIDDERGSDK